MRRKVGASAWTDRERARDAYRAKASAVDVENDAHVKRSVERLKKQLREFATRHKKRINADPEIRAEFSRMCARLHVDALAKNSMWERALGLRSFYDKLGAVLVTSA